MVIFQTWKSKTDIPRPFRIWSATWRKFHPDWEYVLWDDADNRRFVEENYPQYVELYNSFPREIYRVDFVRYLFLYHFGGLYADLDFECLRPLHELLAATPQSLIFGRMGADADFPHSVPNAIMISKTPGHPFWMHVVEHIATSPVSWVENTTGPVMLRRMIGEHPDDVAVIGPPAFYPIDWNTEGGRRLREMVERGRLFTDDEKNLLFPTSLAVTYWSHTW